MIGFEKYLQSQGWVVEGGYKTPTSSQPGCLINLWKKDGLTITVGLNEVGKPPTVIYPRWIVRIAPCVLRKINDDEMNRALLKIPNSEIYDKLLELLRK